MVQFRPLFLPDHILESPDSLCRLKFNRKDATGIFADNPTIEADCGRHNDSLESEWLMEGNNTCKVIVMIR
jgi:hypothetical protein